ncbi:hypothetical protein NSE01_34070 [Novosphingobium sediminis]|uniref:Alpha/beta hydrolase n=1 Tax=Novosphingobium sediminis TaxID=707214 RepID=A0A512APE5_9SPHN|nr:hypothetical protein [Novosphingobium sediminis]GEO01575.1 hypothetical protein NSE01_34070 [Novosphingobium sediminis]
MEALANLPFIRLSTDKAGVLEAGSALSLPAGTTDLIVMSHGWRNDTDDALTLYSTLIGNVKQAAGATFAANNRSWAVAGVFWPAYRFEPDLSIRAQPQTGAPAPTGGALAIGDNDLPEHDLRTYAEEFAELLDCDTDAFAAAALKGANGGKSANDFFKLLRSNLTPDPKLKGEHKRLLTARGSEFLSDLKSAATAPTQFDTLEPAAGAGEAAGFTDIIRQVQRVFTGGRAAVATALNYATYYEMKARAGVIGKALAPVVEQAAGNGVRVHLIGHSFGARLVTSLANELASLKPASMSLLQGAFSHNALGIKSNQPGGAATDGLFRKVIAGKRVSGPFLVTHTRRDTAVGFAYPAASALSGTTAANFIEAAQAYLGGPTDPYGGIGANGALSLKPGEDVAHVAVLRNGKPLLAPRGNPGAAAAPVLSRGLVNNVLADAIISEHWDVKNPNVAALVWAAIG